MKNSQNNDVSPEKDLLLRKIAKRTIGPAASPPEAAAAKKTEGKKGRAFQKSVFLRTWVMAIAGGAAVLAAIGVWRFYQPESSLWRQILGFLDMPVWGQGAATPDMRMDEESKVSLGSLLLFVTVILGLVASLAAAIRLTTSVLQERRIRRWPQAPAQLPFKNVSLPFDDNGECRPRVEYMYYVEGQAYRSGRLPLLTRTIREIEGEEARRHFARIQTVRYNPQNAAEAYLEVPEYYLDSFQNEILWMGFALGMSLCLSVALWYVADEVIPVLLRVAG